jgi:hypothetical protein
MVSNDPIKDYMRRHACGFPEALEALAAQLGPPPPTTSDAPCRRWAGPGRRWIYLRRWKPGAPTRSSRRHNHRTGAPRPSGNGSLACWREPQLRNETDMDTEHRVIGELLALKGAPDDVLLDQVAAIGERAARHMLFDEAVRLQHTDQATAVDCAALVNRIDELIRPA